MTNFGGNFSFNSFPIFKNIGNQAKNLINKLNPTINKEQIANINQGIQNEPGKSLTNTNSNINLNQSTQASPVITQGTLNISNKPQSILPPQDYKTNNENIQNQKVLQTGSQSTKDIPSYASIPNMSMKSWVSDHQGKNYTELSSGEKTLKSTLEGIEGFEKRNYDGEGEQSGKGNKNNSKEILIILSKIFSTKEQTGAFETNLFSNIINFKKLGSAGEGYKSLSGETYEIYKNIPPTPEEIPSIKNLNSKTIKYLHELLALPEQFPECLRLFAKERIQINSNELKDFLVHRLEITQEQLFTQDAELNKLIARFVPLIGQGEQFLLLSFILLYYPLPLPYIRENFDFYKAWGKNRKEKEEGIIASCEIYYFSKQLGRFLLRFVLDVNNNFSFDVETSPENEKTVKKLERAISEAMFLVSNPPKLSELNVLVSKEIYKATDIDEELSIVSSGPLRIEIMLSVYACLVILNSLNKEPDPSGVIEISD